VTDTEQNRIGEGGTGEGGAAGGDAVRDTSIPTGPAVTAAAPPVNDASRGPGRAGLVAGVLAILVALAIGAWAMQRFARIEGEIARRLQAAEQQVTAFDAMLGQSRDLLRDLQGRNAVLESKLAETAGLQAQVEKLFRDRAEDSFDVTLAEAESGLALAAQQLALGADVEAVLGAIQNIEARLARESDARLAPVRAVLARDIERLRVHPSSDVGRLALRLDALIAALDQLPLLATIREPVETANGLVEAAPAGAAPAPPSAPASDGPAPVSTADRIGATVSAFGKELRDLFRVRRVDSPDAVLVAPQQAYFLRQNLRLMLLNARLALLSRNGDAYRADLERARRWIDSYYDGEHRNVVAVHNQLRQMLDAKLVLEPPRIDDSLAAVRKARAAVR
jgi:uroporphyrin-3 C-methyltransferase